LWRARQNNEGQLWGGTGIGEKEEGRREKGGEEARQNNEGQFGGSRTIIESNDVAGGYGSYLQDLSNFVMKFA
jgi:hypothetical protein